MCVCARVRVLLGKYYRNYLPSLNSHPIEVPNPAKADPNLYTPLHTLRTANSDRQLTPTEAYGCMVIEKLP